MNRNLLQIKTKITDFWKNRSKLQKILLIGIVALAVILSIIIGIVASSNKMVRSIKICQAEETGQIKQVSDAKGIPSEVATQRFSHQSSGRKSR